MIKRLRPITPRPQDVAALKRAVQASLREQVYAPLLVALSRPLKNSNSTLVDALLTGDIKYEDGAFKGKFTAGLSKELKALGAKWKDGAWTLSPSRVPSSLKEAIEKRVFREEALRKFVLALIPDAPVVPEEVPALDAVHHANTQFQKNIASVRIKAPKLSVHSEASIAAAYTDNLQLSIAKFSKEETQRLRAAVQAHVFKGDRADSLKALLKASWGVTERKAEFLAKNEISILTSHLTAERYASAGVDDYEWRTVTGTAAHPVRHMHRALNGTKQRFSLPPVVNPQGQRKNPGIDWNCRCIAVPIVKF